MRPWFLICIVGLGLAAPVSAQEGRLQQVRNAVDQPPKADNSAKKKDSDSSDDDDRASPAVDRGDDDDSGSNGLFVTALGAGFLSPFALPYVAMQDDLRRGGYFPRFPHDEGSSGYLRFPADENEAKSLRSISGRLTLEYGLQARDIDRLGTRLLIDTTSRLGFSLSNDYFHESRPCGRHDSINLTTPTVTGRFAQSNWMQMYAGVGMNILDDRRDRKFYGVNFLYGADIFPVKPFVVSAFIEGGNVGDAGLFRSRATVGANWRRFEGFIGYDYLNIGGVDLQGPLAGIRFWY